MSEPHVTAGRAVRRVVRLGGGRVGVEVGPVGGAVGVRLAMVAVGAVAVAVAAFVGSLTMGTYRLSAGQVVDVLLGRGAADATLIVQTLRLPRALTGLLVGLAFGLAGALTQAVARNPLASPDVLGVGAGASAGGVAAILVGGATAARADAFPAVPAGAFAGALAAGGVVYAMAYRGRTLSGYRLVLVGLGVQGALVSVTRWLLARADIDQASRAMVWLTGSLNGRDLVHAVWVGVALAVLVPVAAALARPYALLQFGDDTSAGLGVRASRGRAGLLLTAVLATAAATAAAGPVGFVALAAPQLARRLAGAPGVPLLTSALVGAALVEVADLVARTAFGAVEVPVGIVTAVAGAPYLLWLLARLNRAGTGG